MGIGQSSCYQDARRLNAIDVVTSSGKNRENLLIDDSSFWESEGKFPHLVQIILPSDVILCQIAVLYGNEGVKTPKNIKTVVDTSSRSVKIAKQNNLNWVTVWKAHSKIIKSTNPIIEVSDGHGGEVVRLCGIQVLGYSSHHSGYIDSLRDRIPFEINQSITITDQILNMRAMTGEAGADLELLSKNQRIKTTVNSDSIEIFSTQGHVFVVSDSALYQRSSTSQLTWSFVVSGQLDWCCGLISDLDVAGERIPTSFPSIGLASNSSTVFQLPVCDMHEKLVSITVDSIINVAAFFVNGLLEKRFGVPVALYPLRIGFYGVGGSKITLLRSAGELAENPREIQGDKGMHQILDNRSQISQSTIKMLSLPRVSIRGVKVSHDTFRSANSPVKTECFSISRKRSTLS